MNCLESESYFVDALYGELPADLRKAFEDHLRDCDRCFRAFGSLRETQTAMNLHTRPAMDAERWDHVWKRIRPAETAPMETSSEAARPHAVRSPMVFRFPGWAYGIAAMLLVAFGLFLGKHFWPGSVNADHEEASRVAGMFQRPDSSRLRVEQEAIQYLDRSKVLLQDIVNTPDDADESRNLEVQQQISRELIVRAAYFRTELKAPEQQRLRQLVQDLEVILLQLANTETRSGAPIIEIVRHGVREKSLWLKINMEELRSITRAAAQPNHTRKGSPAHTYEE